MGAFHSYTAQVVWTGAGDSGTASYTSYSRDHSVVVDGKVDLLASADPAFRGDPSRHTPEELFVASLAQCHMLWFLHLASAAGIVVREYVDSPVGTMRVEAAGAGQFTEVELRPRVAVELEASDGSHAAPMVAEVHERAHSHCFLARSVNFPVTLRPVVHAAAVMAPGRL